MASYFPSVKSPRQSSPVMSPRQLSPLQSSPRQLSPLLSSARTPMKTIVKRVSNAHIKSNDWNMVLEEVFKHIKHHGVTTKLIDMIKEHNWDTVHHVMKRALLISAIKWEIGHLMALFVLLDHVKDKFRDEIENVMDEWKLKIKEYVSDEESLGELKAWLM